MGAGALFIPLTHVPMPDFSESYVDAAAGDLDLYDLRAVVCEIGTDDGAGGVGGEVKDFDALKYFHVFISTPSSRQVCSSHWPR